MRRKLNTVSRTLGSFISVWFSCASAGQLCWHSHGQAPACIFLPVNQGLACSAAPLRKLCRPSGGSEPCRGHGALGACAGRCETLPRKIQCQPVCRAPLQRVPHPLPGPGARPPRDGHRSRVSASVCFCFLGNSQLRTHTRDSSESFTLPSLSLTVSMSSSDFVANGPTQCRSKGKLLFFPSHRDPISCLPFLSTSSWGHCWFDSGLLCFQSLPEFRPASRGLRLF